MKQSTDIAIDELIDEFSSRFEAMGYSQDHLVLACHAAFPIAVTADMLYQIWGNFRMYGLKEGRPRPYKDGMKPYSINPIAVADVLLWDQWHEIRPEVYELDPAVRAGLLERLSTYFSASRWHELAAFLYQYVEEVIGQRYGAAFLEAQQWTAMATLAPQQTARNVTEKLAKYTAAWNESEILRLRQLVGALRSHDDRFDELLWTLKGLRATIFQMDETVVRDQFRQIHLVDSSTDSGSGASIMSLPLPISFQDKLPLSLPPVDPEKPVNRLYALVVGIDQYPSDLKIDGRPVLFPTLQGGARDALKVEAYLNDYASFEPHIECITNAQATKSTIVRLFKEHLGKAQAGDTVLFYFSGLGAQEEADPIWNEIDGRLESMACYCTNMTRPDFLLAGQEFGYLIQTLSKKGAHIVTLLDCSFSASITRSGYSSGVPTAFPIPKSIPFVFPQREWHQFIFSERISRDYIRKAGVSAAFPSGNYLSMTACDSDESAMEISAEGIFTKILLTVLKVSESNLSYYTLRSRVRQYLQVAYDQKPQLQVIGNPELLNSPFLNGAVKGLAGEVIYSETDGWRLHLGSNHDIDKERNFVSITDPEPPFTSFQVTIDSVQTETSRLRLDEKARAALDPSRTYKGSVEKLKPFTFRLHVKNIDGYPEDLQRLMDELFKASSRQIELEDDESKAHYVIRCRNGTFYITKPNDPYRPLVAPINTGKADSVLVLTDDLRHIGQWEYLRSLTPGPGNTPFLVDDPSPLKVDLFYLTEDGDKTQILTEGNEASIGYEKINGRWQNTLLCRLTNQTDLPLYCAVLYLTPQFGSFIRFLSPSVYLLDPGHSVELGPNGSHTMKAQWNDVERLFNWEETTEFLKIIISNEPFDSEPFALKELPGAKALQNLNTPPTRGADVEKGFLDFDRENNVTEQLTSWTSQHFTLHFRNPEYNTINEEDLDAMLEDPDIADFALGLYFDVTIGSDLQTHYSIKKKISIKPNENESSSRSFSLQINSLNLADRWGRDRRHKQYRETLLRFPSKSRIVSVGDSWFQHPLIKDTIDFLSQSYPIYCLAAAGGNLREDIRKKDVWAALETQNPQILLISLGSNDLLGGHFQSFFNDKFSLNVAEGEQPARFLKPSFLVTLDTVGAVYRTFFRDVQSRAPGLQIITHGYDYIIPIDSTSQGWVGQYMIRQGVSRQADRQAIMRYIIDEYNRILQAVSEPFANVSYLDLRNTVQPDQWYDEIHPNEHGFQQIALKFENRMADVLKNRITYS